MNSDIPNLIMGNQPPSSEIYAMECTLEVSKREVFGSNESTSTCKWSGFASLEVVRKILDMMCEVVSE